MVLTTALSWYSLTYLCVMLVKVPSEYTCAYIPFTHLEWSTVYTKKSAVHKTSEEWMDHPESDTTNLLIG